MEIHIYDRCAHSYDVIKDFVGASPAAALVLMDHHNSGPEPEESWIGSLLQDGVISTVYWITEFSMDEPETAERANGRIIAVDMRQIDRIKLPKNFILSIDLDMPAYEKNSSSVDFLRRIIKWMNTQKPGLVTVALSGAYQNSSDGMYSSLTEIIQSLPLGSVIYLESAAPPERFEEPYRRQNRYSPDSPDKSLDPNIPPDPWIWYSLPVKCTELLKKRNVVIKGENRENILAVWNDTAHKKLRKTYNGERQKEILQAARGGIFRFWDDAKMPDLPPLGPNEGLAIRLISRGEDRGCLTWYKNSGDMNLFAAYCAAKALRDPRYTAVTPDEAGNLFVELAIFGDWEDMSNPQEFIPGYHNLWLSDGVHNTILQASLVPQRNYTKEDFLENICKKAGLEKNAWKENANLKWKRSPGLWLIEPLHEIPLALVSK
ncbi:MAG: AMMECR1 domain-containing protein [Spirochaetaceae bacterium]|jgi:AMMECR1 domain-containing protein|nr:AMMECR1 domain-containing protein [Spirochaetaceae bacterium]